jgi:predicted nucleic acid-binding protein
MTCVVADSGPLIALAVLESLHLPGALWGQLLVPQTVLDECAELTHKTGAGQIRRAVEEGVIEVRADALLGDEIPGVRLDPGESQAILLARRMQAVLLMDERRGRKTASLLEIPHIGTCGLLARAKRSGLIRQVSPLLDRLLASGYFLAPALVSDTLRVAGESPDLL